MINDEASFPKEFFDNIDPFLLNSRSLFKHKIFFHIDTFNLTLNFSAEVWSDDLMTTSVILMRILKILVSISNYFGFWRCSTYNIKQCWVWQYTWYLSFLLHRRECWVHFCSTQKWVNWDKMDIAPKHCKSQKDNTHCKFVMWSNFVMRSID